MFSLELPKRLRQKNQDPAKKLNKPIRASENSAR
jgi:hypothetical protein